MVNDMNITKRIPLTAVAALLAVWLGPMLSAGQAQTSTVLKHFTGSDGAWPDAGLVLSGSTLYGTTSLGGSSNKGTVFQMNTDGTGYTVLKNYS